MDWTAHWVISKNYQDRISSKQEEINELRQRLSKEIGLRQNAEEELKEYQRRDFDWLLERIPQDGSPYYYLVRGQDHEAITVRNTPDKLVFERVERLVIVMQRKTECFSQVFVGTAEAEVPND